MTNPDDYRRRADPDEVDWNDPEFVLVAGAGGRPEYTVADVMEEMKLFNEDGLRLVARADVSWLATYLNRHNPS